MCCFIKRIWLCLCDFYCASYACAVYAMGLCRGGGTIEALRCVPHQNLAWWETLQSVPYQFLPLHFKIRSTSTPSYLRLLIRDREHGRNLRSTTMALCQPFTATTFAKLAFQCSAPAVWNSLPQTVLSSDSVAVFKLRLKAFLFSQAFSFFSAH